MNNYWFLGIVENEEFIPLVSENNASGQFRLTGTALGTEQSAETAQVSLIQYEGSAVMVRGIARDGWIHSAVVVDHAGPIVTVLVQQVFRSGQPIRMTP